jgi:hypothetical protein
MTRSYVTVAVTTPNKGVAPGIIKGVLEVFPKQMKKNDFYLYR